MKQKGIEEEQARMRDTDTELRAELKKAKESIFTMQKKKDISDGLVKILQLETQNLRLKLCEELEDILKEEIIKLDIKAVYNLLEEIEQLNTINMSTEVLLKECA